MAGFKTVCPTYGILVNPPLPKPCASPDALWHVNVLPMPINVGHQRKVCLEALDGEDPVHKGVEETLVKVIVDATTIDTLGEQGSHGTPGHLVGGKVGPSLQPAYMHAQAQVTGP